MKRSGCSLRVVHSARKAIQGWQGTHHANGTCLPYPSRTVGYNTIFPVASKSLLSVLLNSQVTTLEHNFTVCVTCAYS